MQQSREGTCCLEAVNEDIRNPIFNDLREFDKRGIDIFCKEIRDKIKKEYLSELE